MLFPKSSLQIQSFLLLQKWHNCFFFLRKKNDETALTMQWQNIVNSSFQPKMRSSLHKGETKTRVLSNMQNWQHSSPNKDIPLWHLCWCRTATYWTSVPSETLCGLITVLTQTNDFLWGMHSALQFPQKRKKQAKNTSALLMNSTWSRINDFVQKKQHQRQPRTPWSRLVTVFYRSGLLQTQPKAKLR